MPVTPQHERPIESRSRTPAEVVPIPRDLVAPPAQSKADTVDAARTTGAIRRRTRGLRLIPLALFLVALVPGALGAQSTEPTDEDLFIVLLRSPSVAEDLLDEHVREPAEGRRALRRDSSIPRRTEILVDSQEALIDRIALDVARGRRLDRPRFEIVGRCTFLLNALFVRADPEVVRRLQEDSDVFAVRASEPRVPLLDHAAEVVRAEALWDAVGGVDRAGEGVKIGIIDSGINLDHPMFSPAGMTMPAGFPKGQVDFTNAKVVAARSYDRLFPGAPANTVEKPPIDELSSPGHGTLVAAAAAGRRVPAAMGGVLGIAPMAHLGNYRVFGSARVTSSAAVLAAIDEAARDGMDVINLSLGGSRRHPGTDPEQLAIARAVELGIVVVVAAGNLGPTAASVTSPGTSPDAITVGAVSHSRALLPGIEIHSGSTPPRALIPYAIGQGISIPSPLGPLPLLPVELIPGVAGRLACTALPSNSLSDRVALVSRGECTFQEKAAHVFAAGARAMVVHDNADGPLFTMAFTVSPSRPAILIGRRDGEELRDFHLSLLETGNPGVAVTIRRQGDQSRFPVPGDDVGSFSGRGPGTDGSVKPDLVAVGSGVYTASNVGSEFALNATGTSFATPMVAGAAALLRQLHPHWTPQAVKSALVSTAVKTPLVDGRPARGNEMGNGRLDLSRAAQVTALLDPVSLSLGTHVGSRIPEEPPSRSLTLTNPSAEPRSYSIGFEATLENPSIRIDIDPVEIVLAPGEAEIVRIRARYLAPLAGGVHEGFLTVGDGGGGPLLTVPVWHQLVVADPNRVLAVSQSGAHDFNTLEAAIQAARPGNIIEIADSATYPVEITIETGQDGLSLHGLTLRARPGQTPTLDGGGAGLSPTLRVNGLDRVSLEGLRIRGGLTGIHFVDASGVIRNCIIEGGNSDAGYGIHLENSAVHLFGNSVTGAGGHAVQIDSGQALLQANHIVGDPAHVGSGVRAIGTDAVGLFDNQLIEINPGENAPAVLLHNSKALLRGNLISATRGAGADAVRARGPATMLHSRDNAFLGNEGAGIHLQLGAKVSLSRDRIRNNGFAGIWATGASTLIADAMDLTANEGGILAADSWVHVANSLLARSASDGVRAGGTASLRLLNNTIVESGGFGLAVDDAPQALLANSVVSGNALGDLVGLEAQQVVSSEVGGDPAALLHLADDRYTPRAPLIDRGSPDYVDGPADLRGRVRVVDGLGDGVAEVDLGAIEFGSDWAPALVLPVLTRDPDQFMGLALSNAHSPAGEAAFETGEPGAPSRVRIRGHGGEGHAPETEFDLPSLEQRARLLTEWLDSPADWIEIQASRPDLVGFALTGDDELSRLDGFALSSRPARTLVFPEVRTGSKGSTTLFLVNPHPSEERVLIRWTPPPGSAEREVERRLTPRGSERYPINELFPGAEDGYLTAETVSGRPLFGMELFGTESAVAGLAALDGWETSSTLFGAQLAVAKGIDTLISLVNLGPTDAVILEAVSETGGIAAVKFVTIEGGRGLRGSASTLLGLTDFVGWLRVRSTSGGALLGSLAFEDPEGRFSAALPLQSRGARESILSHVAHTADIFTGITLLNPDPERALISLEVFDEAGTRVGLALDDLPGLNKRALLLPEWFPGLAEQTGGFIRIRSNRKVMSFELFGSDEYLAAVPQQVVVH